ncbi:VOC family protein [Sphingopyxis solisilvae]|uniref:VOC family protein n=1 Tax=Sphingopyxis solisilvae TaxID=1886788 RepID=UPI002B4AC5C8|nr:VOC family protein [Sphingopyxis solisilvae]
MPDLAAGERFYTSALGLTVARRFDNDIAELTGCEVPIYLIAKRAGSAIGPGAGDFRRYNRHWTPVHPDFSVARLEDAARQAVAAGAVQEGETLDLPYGRQAMFADPFGNGFCLIEFNERGYDALLP